MWSEFRLILEKVLGENREYLALSDELAFSLLMEVVWNGATHSEAAEDVCRTEDLIERHREYVASGALSTFLMIYSPLHYRISSLIQESGIAVERARPHRSGQMKGV